MTGSAQTDFNRVSTRRVKPKLGIERGHPENLIFGYFQKTRKISDRLLRDISVLFLRLLKERNQISLLAFEPGKYILVIFIFQRRSS
jgi:hypothetical protein